MRIVGAIALATVVVIGLGCGDDSDRANLILEFTFDGLLCDAAGVYTINVAIVGQEQGEGLVDRFDCPSVINGLEIPSLIPDLYEFSVFGLSREGVRLYSTVLPLQVRLNPNADQMVVVDVPFTTGDLALLWELDGRFACDVVDDVRVRLVDPFDGLLDDGRYDCESGGVFYGELQTGVYLFEMTALDASSAVLFRSGEQAADVSANQRTELVVDLGAAP